MNNEYDFDFTKPIEFRATVKRKNKGTIKERLYIYNYNNAEFMETNVTTEDFVKINKENKNLNSILNELEEWLKERQDYAYEYENVLNKIQELKEKYK